MNYICSLFFIFYIDESRRTVYDIHNLANSLPSDTPVLDDGLELFREDVSALITQNPTAVVLMMQRMVHALHECLMGIPVEIRRTGDPDFSSRKNGILGRGKAFFDVTELQGRNALHWHGLYWTGTQPWVVQRSAGSEIGYRLAHFTKRMHSACANARLHAVKLFKRLAGTSLRSAYFCPPPVRTSAYQLDRLGEVCMVCTNGHSHCASCRKSERGETECRLQYPRPTSDTTDTFYELRPIVTDEGVKVKVNCSFF